MNNFRSLNFARLLAMLPPIVATQFSFCGPQGSGTCDTDASFPALAQADGAPASVAASAQCANPGPLNTPCSEPVRCGPQESCCGRWTCVPQAQAGILDASPGFAWSREYCVGGPQVPPSLGTS